MTFTICETLHQPIFNGLCFQTAEKIDIETRMHGKLLPKNETFFEKVEQRAVIKFLAEIRKSPTETKRILK